MFFKKNKILILSLFLLSTTNFLGFVGESNIKIISNFINIQDVFLILFWLAAYNLGAKRVNIFQNQINIQKYLIIILLLIVGIHLISGLFFSSNIKLMLSGIRRFSYWSSFFLFGLFIDDKKDLFLIIKNIYYLSLLCCLSILVEILTRGLFHASSNSELYGIYRSYNPGYPIIHFATILIIINLISGHPQIIAKKYLIAIFVSNLIIIFINLSRTIWILMLLIILLSLVINYKVKIRNIAIFAGVSIIAIIIVNFVVFNELNIDTEFVSERLLSGYFDLEDKSSNYYARANALQLRTEFVDRESMLFGLGFNWDNSFVSAVYGATKNSIIDSNTQIYITNDIGYANVYLIVGLVGTIIYLFLIFYNIIWNYVMFKKYALKDYGFIFKFCFLFSIFLLISSVTSDYFMYLPNVTVFLLCFALPQMLVEEREAV